MADMTQLLALINGAAKRPKPNGFDPEFLADESVDPSVRADAGLGAMTGELRNRVFQAERSMNPVQDGVRSPNATSPNEVNALKNLLTGYQAERSDPTTPLNVQTSETNLQRAGELDAINEGFTGGTQIGRYNRQLGGGYTNKVNDPRAPMSPMQQREIYNRGQAEYSSPRAMQNARIENEQFQQGRQLNSLNRQINAQMEPARMREERLQRQWDAISKDPALAERVRKMGNAGMEFFNPNPSPLNQTSLMNQLGDAQGVMDTKNPFATWNDPSPTQQNFNRRVTSYLQGQGIDPQGMQGLITALRDPAYANMSLEDLKRNAMFMEDGVTPDPSFDERDWQKWVAAYIYLKSASGQ